MCQSANDLIRAGAERRKSEITQPLNLCESPVEQILRAALYEFWHADAITTLNRIECHLAANYLNTCRYGATSNAVSRVFGLSLHAV